MILCYDVWWEGMARCLPRPRESAKLTFDVSFDGLWLEGTCSSSCYIFIASTSSFTSVDFFYCVSFALASFRRKFSSTALWYSLSNYIVLPLCVSQFFKSLRRETSDLMFDLRAGFFWSLSRTFSILSISLTEFWQKVRALVENMASKVTFPGALTPLWLITSSSSMSSPISSLNLIWCYF